MRTLTPKLAIPFDGHCNGTPRGTTATVEGPHRFPTLHGITGYQPTSLKTSCHIPTDLHLANEGTIAIRIAPLETLAVAVLMRHVAANDPNAHEYGILADTFPVNDPEKSVFAWYWRSFWHPQMIAKFKNGGAGGGNADYSVTPYVPVEHLPLKLKQWYELVFSWNKEKGRLFVYANGILCGTTSYPFRADVPHPGLYLGNTAMVFSNLRIYDTELTGAEISREWHRAALPGKKESEKEIAALHTPQPRPRARWRAGGSWKLEYDNPLTATGSFKDWIQQGCLEPGFALEKLETTPEGLLIETPQQIHRESRVYFWSPRIFEGDLAVEFDFRPESVDGLALLVLQASGMQREDFITDHPSRTTGAMKTIIGDRVRNYHWEFFRHAVDVRGDLGTSVLVKNPWQHPLGLATRASFVTGEWCKLLFLQEGDRLRTAINGEWLLDVRDNPCSNNGPVLNCGRIGLRLMYQTRMRFRNLRVWNRDSTA